LALQGDGHEKQKTGQAQLAVRKSAVLTGLLAICRPLVLNPDYLDPTCEVSAHSFPVKGTHFKIMQCEKIAGRRPSIPSF